MKKILKEILPPGLLADMVNIRKFINLLFTCIEEDGSSELKNDLQKYYSGEFDTLSQLIGNKQKGDLTLKWVSREEEISFYKYVYEDKNILCHEKSMPNFFFQYASQVLDDFNRIKGI